MRVYSITYDEDSAEIQPFVYAQDLSSKGNNIWYYRKKNCWESYPLAKGAAVLLSHGDRLRLLDGTILRFRSEIASSECAQDFDDLRDCEKDVCRTFEGFQLMLRCFEVFSQHHRCHKAQIGLWRLRYCFHGY